VALLLVVAAGLAAAAFLARDAGALSLARWWEPPEQRVPPGKVTVPLSARTIPAYTRITRDHVWDAKSQRLTVTFMDPGQLDGIVVDLKSLFGRVLAREKSAGYVFTEDDFLQRGTRPGLVAGIPAGMRAVRLEADRIRGLHGLAAGDRFDLVATIPIDGKAAPAFPLTGVHRAQVEMQARMSNWQKQATVRAIVQNGFIVAPVAVRAAPTTTQSLTRGATTTTRPVQEVVIAVKPEEVAPLTEALAVKADVMAVPRSGRPDDPFDTTTPDLQPWNPFGATEGLPSSYTIVETIAGAKREATAVPRR
jgi:Flp pilus assembly protein CpaB